MNVHYLRLSPWACRPASTPCSISAITRFIYVRGKYSLKQWFLYFFLVALRPNVGHSHLILEFSRSRITVGRTSLHDWSVRRRDLYLTTHNTHNRQTSIGPPGQVISPSQRPLPDNTQHSQQTDIHRTPLDKWSARRTDLYLTKHNTHNRQTSIGPPGQVISPSQRPLPDNT